MTLTANPDPATASGPTGVQYKVTNADSTVSYYDYDYRTSFTVTIQENAGTALDITAIDLKVQQATGGIVITPSGGDQIYFKFNSSAVTNRINANGSADVGFDAWYDLPNGGREALITVGISLQGRRRQHLLQDPPGQGRAVGRPGGSPPSASRPSGPLFLSERF